MISISKKNKSKPYRVHRLIAETFIPNPQKLPEVNHKDGNKLNNEISNLEWCTHLDNMIHAFNTGLANNTGSKNGMAKLSISEAKEIKGLLRIGELSQQNIADKFNVSRSCILAINIGRIWKTA